MNEKVTKTVQFELDSTDVGYWLANAGSDEQAEVLNIVERVFSKWEACGYDNQLLSIARLLTPHAKKWIKDLHESVEFVNGIDARRDATTADIPDGITPHGAQVVS